MPAHTGGMIKKFTRASILAAGCAASLAAMPAEAEAAPLAFAMPGALPLAAVGTMQLGCANPALSAAPTANITMPTVSKSAAILGGQISALERMRMQQNGATSVAAPAEATSFAPALPAATSALPIVALGLSCPAVAGFRSPAAESFVPRLDGGEFLGTERVRIGRTRFDAEWKRVATKRLSSRDLTKAIGAVPQERMELLSQVNRWVNHAVKYRSDGGRDYWADARQTLRSRAGDCEDYAILKMQMLAAAGVRKDDMMLTLARDTMRRVDHAVLLVKHEDSWLMLDLQSDNVVPATGHYGYKPVMSFAEDASYLHGKRYDPRAPRYTVQLALAN